MNRYHSVKDDGSFAFKVGNKQNQIANNYLRDVLEKRLRNVLTQYGCSISYLMAFSERDPQWLQESLHQMGIESKFVTVPTAHELAEQKDELARLAVNYRRYSKMERQKSALPFYLLTETKLKQLAYDVAEKLSQMQFDYMENLAKTDRTFDEKALNQITLELYRLCGEVCAVLGFPLPQWERVSANKKVKNELIDIALNKSVSEKYWFRQFRQTQKQMVEHIAIACGAVSKKISPYISIQGFSDWRVQIKKNYDYLKAIIIENIENPEEQAELFDMYLRSSANPALRRNEMMVRLRGLEEWAEESQHHALFLTLTAPSSFHATTFTGDNNRKWTGTSPAETQKYLRKVWGQFRALLKKRKIGFYGMRVAEPHHDATPHWHLLVYIKEEHRDEVIQLFRQKALELDGDEKGAKEHRCKVEDCDKEKGSATAYIAKYIAKNIDGFALDGEMSDEVEGLSLKDNAKRVRAWASLWRIRQFQFFGDASISVWRELRRLVEGQCDDEKLEEMRICADMGDYAAYHVSKNGRLNANSKN